MYVLVSVGSTLVCRMLAVVIRNLQVSVFATEPP